MPHPSTLCLCETIPFSSQLMLRVQPEVHATVAIMAGAKGKRINQLASEVLRQAAAWG